ncbi:hypothetical protein C6500_04600 [Candidatus Poribacteria bacterium]|nr:MAG: hypothetical protein C6500_04600 [Candidatus Poribacteria bacterium]
MKINKRILRCEYAEIVPEAYMPDAETQERLNPNRITYEIHQYVAGHVETEGFVVKMPKHKVSKYIKTVSVYRVFLTKALFKQIHKLPQARKDIVFDSEDVDRVLAILDGCIGTAEDTLNPNLSQKVVHRVWNGIKCTYGGKHAPPDEIIFASYVLEDGDA